MKILIKNRVQTAICPPGLPVPPGPAPPAPGPGCRPASPWQHGGCVGGSRAMVGLVAQRAQRCPGGLRTVVFSPQSWGWGVYGLNRNWSVNTGLSLVMSQTKSTLCRRIGCSDSAGRSKNLNSPLITEHQRILQRNNLRSVSGWELCANSYFQNWLTLTFGKSIFNGACFSLQRWGGRYWWTYKCLAPSEKTSGK